MANFGSETLTEAYIKRNKKIDHVIIWRPATITALRVRAISLFRGSLPS